MNRKTNARLKRRLVVEQGGKCAWCGHQLNPEVIERQPTLDHVVPRSKGGWDTSDNIVVACRLCNDTRGNRMPDRIPASLTERLERERLQEERRQWDDPRAGEDEEWEDT